MILSHESKIESICSKFVWNRSAEISEKHVFAFVNYAVCVWLINIVASIYNELWRFGKKFGEEFQNPI